GVPPADTASRHDHLRSRRAESRAVVRDHVRDSAAAGPRGHGAALRGRDAGDRARVHLHRPAADRRERVGRPGDRRRAARGYEERLTPETIFSPRPARLLAEKPVANMAASVSGSVTPPGPGPRADSMEA